MSCETQEFQIRDDAPLRRVIRWEAPPIVWKPIVSISHGAPATLKVPSHGCPPDWRVEVSSKKSMREIDGFKGRATVVDANTIELNTLNTSGFKPYKGDGFLAYYTPVDMTGMTARLRCYDRKGGTVLLELDHTDGVTLDVANCKIEMLVTLEQMQTKLGDRKKFYVELDLIDSLGDPNQLLGATVVRSPS